MTGREQFEAWYFKRYGVKDLTVVRNHAEFCDAWEVWQASRAAIEISLGPYLNPLMFNGDVLFGYHKGKSEALDSIRAAGLKIKGE